MLSCEFERSQVLCKSVEAKCSQASIIFAKLSRTSSIEKGMCVVKNNYILEGKHIDLVYCGAGQITRDTLSGVRACVTKCHMGRMF